MNLVVLVEGAQTEPQVYTAWIALRAPALRPVGAIADLTTSGYVLVSGGGYPRYERAIAGLLEDMDDWPGRVNEFWICVDSDDEPCEARRAEVEKAVEKHKRDRRLSTTNPLLRVRILIQHCCIETWFLGNDRLMASDPKPGPLADLKQFWDVSVADPEEMGTYRGYPTRANFHTAYLRAMLAEHRIRYTKSRPGVVLEPSYLEALEARCLRTGHVPSFRRLLDALAAVGTPGPRV